MCDAGSYPIVVRLATRKKLSPSERVNRLKAMSYSDMYFEMCDAKASTTVMYSIPQKTAKETMPPSQMDATHLANRSEGAVRA